MIFGALCSPLVPTGDVLHAHFEQNPTQIRPRLEQYILCSWEPSRLVLEQGSCVPFVVHHGDLIEHIYAILLLQ